MKKLWISVATGAVVSAALVYLVYKGRETGELEKLCDSIKGYSNKAKRNVKNAWDKGVNEIEYLKERAEDKLELAQAKIMKNNKTVEE